VVQVAVETDIERLRQMALLLERENARLHQRLLALTRELAAARGLAASQLELELQHLQETLSARTRQLFGASSEKRSRPAEGVSGDPPATPPRHGHGPRAHAQLPLVAVTHELDAPDQICPKCGGDLQAWTGQFETAEEVDVVERSFRLVRHHRQKYRCRCGSCVETALGPPKLIAGGRYSVDFAVAVAIGKYTDHLPLARQVRQMARLGVVLDTQTLWDQLWALAQHLRPTYEALHAAVLAAAVIGADETTWRLMQKPQMSKWWAWVVCSPTAVCYRILSTRSAQAAATVLRDYRGIVMIDGYSAYTALQREIAESGNRVAFEVAHCWAHVRRKFVDAEPHYPQATEVLTLIGQLYAVEAQARERPAATRAVQLLALRQRESAPVVTAIGAWLEAQRHAVLPQSALGKAIHYARDLWPGLIKFLNNPAIPLDNNATERSLRGVALGRKNHYGSRSLRGTEAAALFYSLIESAKLVALEPAAYLTEATRRAIANPGTVTLPGDLLTPNTG
jgi:transposase